MRLFSLFTILFIVQIACTNEDFLATTPSIDGEPITFTNTEATNTGSGIEIILTDQENKITIHLDGAQTGKYVIQNQAGRTAANSKAQVSVLHDSKLYYGTTGNIDIKNNNGMLSLQTSDLIFKSWAEESISLSAMSIDNIQIAEVPEGCRITSYSYSVEGLQDCYHDREYSFSYNAEGKISRASGTGGELFFNYDLEGNLLGYTGVEYTLGGNLLVNLMIQYEDTLITSFEITKVSDSDSVKSFYYPSQTFLLTYAEDNISEVSVSSISNEGYKDDYFKSILYNENNVAEVKSTYDKGTIIDTKKFSAFDDKKNPYRLMATLMSSDISFINGGLNHDFELFSLHNNNPQACTIWAGQQRFTYTYNSNGYPTEIIFTPHSEEFCTGDVTIRISYVGCN